MEVQGVGVGGGPEPTSARPKVSMNGGQERSSDLGTSDSAALGCSNKLAEDDEDVCRICRFPGDDESPLYHPCACSGSMKFVHQGCLFQWLSRSNSKPCEVCKHVFSFSPVYADDAPSRLPLQELVLGLALKGARGMRFFVRLLFVLSVWLFVIPYMTCWMWRCSFVKNLSEGRELSWGRFPPRLLLADWFYGHLWSVGIVIIFLGATLLRDYLYHLRVAGLEGEGIGRAGRQVVNEVQAAPPIAVRGGLDADHGVAGGDGQLIRRNAQNAAALLELQAARLEARVEQMFDAVDDPDGAVDIPFDELVGMQGPVFHLVDKAITLLASNAMFFVLAALIPFTLGRVVLFIASACHQVVAIIRGSEMLPSNNVSVVVGNVLSGNLSSVKPGRNLYFDDLFTVAAGSALSDIINGVNTSDVQGNALTEGGMTALRLSNAAIVAVGYGAIVLALSLYLGPTAYIYGGATMAQAAPHVARKVMAGVKLLATVVKVSFLLLIEFVVFPFMCGWWLDISTIALVDVTVAQRLEFFWTSPLTSSSLHWLVGIIYMLQVSIFVGLLREVLRPGVLYFLRDPTDPNYNPFRDLIDAPVHQHIRWVVLCTIMYGSLIVMLVFLPARLAILAAPSIFPLNIGVWHPFTALADVLLFHMCKSYAVKHLRPRATVKAALVRWISLASWALGLSTYLLLDTDDDVNNKGVPEGRDEQAVLAEQRDAVPLLNFSKEGALADCEEGEYMFVLRVMTLLVGAWITLFAFNITMFLIPVLIGRGILGLVSLLPKATGAKCSDYHAFNLGCFVMWATAAAVRSTASYLRGHDVPVLLKEELKRSTIIVAKSFALLSLGIVVIPTALGLLLELLVMVPVRVPIDESSVFRFYEDWALGLFLLTLWRDLVMVGQFTPFADEIWRIRFQQAEVDGFTNLKAFWVLKEIVAPILMKLLTALCVPYVLAYWIFPCLGYSPAVNSAVSRFAWSGCLALGTLWYGMKWLRYRLLDLHNSIRDDRYLVGRTLCNFAKK